MNERFNRYALAASDFVGSTGAFFAALALVAAWAVTGPLMSFSNTWQLIINSGTSILTFLIVFLIQHAQNRDTRSIRLKLDEILRVTEGARPALVDLDRLSDDEIARLEEEFKRWRQRMDRGKP
jgi:low affinity Fe/Cu permease